MRSAEVSTYSPRGHLTSCPLIPKWTHLPSLICSRTCVVGYTVTLKVVQGMQFDPADHTKPNPKLTYRVTVIFCLQPDNCDSMVPFPQTTTIIVAGERIRNDGPRPF